MLHIAPPNSAVLFLNRESKMYNSLFELYIAPPPSVRDMELLKLDSLTVMFEVSAATHPPKLKLIESSKPDLSMKMFEFSQ